MRVYLSLCNRQHTLSVLRVFPSQKSGTDTFSSSHAKFQQFVPSSISLASVAFSLVNLQNIFQLVTSGLKTDASTWSLPSDLFRTNSQIKDRVTNFSQSKRVFSCNHMLGFRESRYETPQAYFHLPQSRLQASTKMHARDTGPNQTVRLRANSEQTKSG